MNSGIANSGSPTYFNVEMFFNQLKQVSINSGTERALAIAVVDTSGTQLLIGAPRANKGVQQTSISSSTAETTIVTAVASTYLDLYVLLITNTSATASKVTIKDSTGGTTRFVIQVPATETRGFVVPVDSACVQSSTGQNWTATCGTSVATIEITALYVKNT